MHQQNINKSKFIIQQQRRRHQQQQQQREQTKKTRHCVKRMMERGVSEGGGWTRTIFVRVLTGLVLLATRTLQSAMAETVYFNSYGDCSQGMRGEAYSLQQGGYTLRATGSGEMHETLICTMTFQAPAGTGVCLSFQQFDVDDCGVSLVIYQQSSASGKQWKKLTCEDYSPPQMCTPERYVTLKLAKTKLNKNVGYHFKIFVDKNSSFTGEDVILASSIGLFVGIIAGVVGFILVIAVIVLCCCCKPCTTQHLLQQGCKGAGGGGPQAGAAGPPAQPSAPPAVEIDDEHTPLQAGPGGPLYPALPLPLPYPTGYRETEEPPPYAPPAYEDHSFAANV